MLRPSVEGRRPARLIPPDAAAGQNRKLRLFVNLIGMKCDCNTCMDAGVSSEIRQTREQIWPHDEISPFNCREEGLIVAVVNRMAAPVAADECWSGDVAEAEAADSWCRL